MAKDKSKKKAKKKPNKKQAGVGDAGVRDAGIRNATAAASNNAAVRDAGYGYLRFIGAFAVSCIGVYFAIQALPSSCTQSIDEQTAWALGLVLHSLGIVPISTVNDTITDGRMAFRIIPECTPLFTAGLFLCFIIFYPASIRQKTAGFLAGTPALYLGNLVRLTTIFVVSRHDRRLFNVVHVYFGQVFTILLVFLTCILWLKWMDKEESKRAIPIKAAGFLVRFAIISGCVFLVWMKIHHGYVWVIDRVIIFGFSLFNHYLEPVRETAVYYETFSVVTFTSLIVALRSISWRIKIKRLTAGLGFLFFTHLFHRIDNVLVVLFNCTAALNADLTLLLIGQYLLPVLVLIDLILRRKREIL